MGARVVSVSAAAVFTAAVVVWAALRGRERRLRREAVSQRLVAGCTSRDNLALREQLDAFRRRLNEELAVPVVDAVPSPRVPSPAPPPPRSSSPAAAIVPSGVPVPCPAVPSFCPSSPPSPVVSSSEGGPQ